MKASRAALLQFMLVLAACGAPDKPMVGVFMGEVELLGGQLALEDMGPELPFDTIIRLSMDGTAEPALRAAREIIALPRAIAVVGHSNSSASLATAPIYNQQRIVQISPNATATGYSEAGPFSFRLAPPDVQQAQVIADVLMSRFAGRRAALLYENDDYGRELRRELRAALPDDSIDWVVDSPHLQDQDSVTADRLAAAVVESRPEVIVWIGRELTARWWFPRLRAGLGDVPIIGSDALAPIGTLTVPEMSPENVWWVDLVDPHATTALEEFSAEFRSRYGYDPIGGQILTYDAVALIAAAVRDGARTGEAVRVWLMSLGRERPPFEGLSGAITFDENGDVTRRHVLCTYRDRVVCR